jgi:hypothetical protein
MTRMPAARARATLLMGAALKRYSPGLVGHKPGFPKFFNSKNKAVPWFLDNKFQASDISNSVA